MKLITTSILTTKAKALTLHNNLRSSLGNTSLISSPNSSKFLSTTCLKISIPTNTTKVKPLMLGSGKPQ